MVAFFFYISILLVSPVLVRSMRLPQGEDGLNLTSTETMTVIGDMIMPNDLYTQLSSLQVLRKIIGSANYRWPEENGIPTIPIKFANSVLEYRSVIEAGIDHWEQHTCIKFRDVTETDRHFIEFIKGNGCWSYVGRIDQDNGQQISIGSGCQYLGTVIHEIGHAVGFIHEQMRPDRDDHLHINFDNVIPNYQNQFEKFPVGDYFTYGVEYDYTSIMQYGGKDFSSNGKLTMATTTVQHQGLLGRGKVLSHRDLLVVNRHYGCIASWEEDCNMQNKSCQNSGYMGSDCQCVCPPDTLGDQCEIIKNGTYYDQELPSCNSFITEETEITSPNYPSNIDRGSWCVYQIQAPEGKSVQLTFDDFYLEKYTNSGAYRCAAAFLEIRNQDKYDGTIACDHDIRNNQRFVSCSQEMVLYLDVPISSKSRGFKARVAFIDSDLDGCQETEEVTPESGKGNEESTIGSGNGEGSVSRPSVRSALLLILVLYRL